MELFSLYIYIENFKNLLDRNHGTDFNITGQECSFGDPYQDCPFRHDLKKKQKKKNKHGVCVGGGCGEGAGRGLFSLYIYIESFKTLLVRNH